MNTVIDGKQHRTGGEWRRRMLGSVFLLIAFLLPFSVLAQIKTTVTDNILGPDGSPATGTMTISAPGAFESADGHNVAQGWRIQIPITGGNFAVNLIPNQGASPSGQNNSYVVVYNLNSSLGTSYWTETWFVPSTGPVGLAAVRTLPSFPATFLSPQTPNTLLSGPASGSSSGPPSFRTLVGADLPFPSSTSLGGVKSLACSNGQFINQISTSGAPSCATPSGSGSGNGSVTSVGLSLPSVFNVSDSPVTSTGTLTATFASQSANLFLASPNGSSGPLAPRAIVPADVPTLNQNTTGTAAALGITPSQCAGGGQAFATGIAANGNANCSNTGFQQRDVAGSLDTISATDHAKGVTYTGSSAVAASLPTATTLGITAFSTSLVNATTGSNTSVVVTPAGSWPIYPNGQSSLSESTLVIAQGQYCFLNVDPSGSAWDSTCHESQISPGASMVLTRSASGLTLNATCATPGTVCASDYGVTSAGAGQVFDAKFTNGAATVNSPSAQWTSAIVGAKVFGTTGPYGDVSGAYNSKLVVGSTNSSSPCTVVTFVDANDITLSCNSNSNASGANNGTFTWGYDQTAALQLAASATTSGNVCETLMLPGGDIFISDAILPTFKCLNGLFGTTSNMADIGWTVTGQGLQGTQLIVTPDMKWSDCTGFNTSVSNSNGCFFSNAGVTLQNLFIQGGGYGNTGLTSNVSLIIGANDDHYINFGVAYLGGNDSHVTGINFVQSGAYCDECWVVAAGATGVNVASNVGAGHWSNSWISQSGNYDLYLNSGSQFRSIKSGFAGQNAGVDAMVFNNGGTWWSTQDAFSNVSATATIDNGSSTAITHLSQPKIYNTSSGTALGAVAGQVYLQEATISSSSGKGLSITGATVFDLGGNENITGSPTVSYASGSVVGDASINGAAQTSTNIALTSGWGTGATVGTVSGNTKWERWVVTPAGTPSSSPVITATFPTPFWMPPTCNLFIVGGGTQLATPSSPTSVTNSNVSWTLAGTPSTSSTYTMVQMCDTNGSSPGSGTLTATGSPSPGNLAQFSAPGLLAPAASYSSVVSLFGGGSCSGYLESNGSCGAPSGSGTVTSSGNPSSGNVAAFSTSTNIVPATASNIVGLFSSCSGTQYLGADGTCHAASGSGTVTNVSFTGDGVLDSSTPSTAVTTSGTVAATVLSQNANTVLGNCTTSIANPSFCSITSAMLPQATSAADGAMTIGVSFTYNASGTTAMGTIASGQIRLLSFHMPYATYASHISYYVSAADNSSNTYDLGLYGPGCNAGASNVPLAAHIGSTAGTTFAPSSGQKYISLASVSTFTPGWYCWAVTSGASSPTANLGGSTTASDSMFGNTTITGGGGSLPSTITAPSISFASAGASSGPNVSLY